MQVRTFGYLFPYGLIHKDSLKNKANVLSVVAHSKADQNKDQENEKKTSSTQFCQLELGTFQCTCSKLYFFLMV